MPYPISPTGHPVRPNRLNFIRSSPAFFASWTF
jgi:hypothetical protein